MKRLTNDGGGGGVARTGAHRQKDQPVGHTTPRLPADPPELDSVPGVPSPAEIDAVAAELPKADRAAFAELRLLMAQHLGSHAAARVWLKSAVPGLEGTPLEAVKAGGSKQLLEGQQAQWGENPPYA